ELEGFDVGQTAVLVFLQGDAGAFFHGRKLRDREDEHLAVVADDGDVIARDRQRGDGLVARGNVEDLFSAARLRFDVGGVDDEALARGRGDEEFRFRIID